VDICSHLKVSRGRVRVWARRFIDQGIEGLKEVGGRGRKSKISPEQKREVYRFVRDFNKTVYTDLNGSKASRHGLSTFTIAQGLYNLFC
jgi:transposase